MEDYEGLSSLEKRFSMQLDLEDEIKLKSDSSTGKPDISQCKRLVSSFIGNLKSLGESILISDKFIELTWINLHTSLSLKSDLKNVITVCDFFTYCCINCLHVLPFLKKFEEDYEKKGVVTLGIHSAKFENEKSNENVSDAMVRYGITHPVANDPELKLWNEMSINCWPTIAIISPNGQLLFTLVGEKSIELYLEFYVDICLEYFRKEIKFENKTAILSNVTKILSKKDLLNFPSKISVSPFLKNVAISNTLNNSIIITNEDGILQFVIGSDRQDVFGFSNGPFDQARFYSPQGLSWMSDDTLLVCDTGNHAVRLIDLKLEIVETLVGNGVMADDKIGGRIGKHQLLNSPWDIAFEQDRRRAYIAIAGSHQIWMLILSREDTKYDYLSCFCLAGDGNEQKRNSRNLLKSSFAQPSGLCFNSDTIYVADSESSSVRAIDLEKHEVNTMVGGNANPLDLFDYGDQDGIGYRCKLQHCMGVCADYDGSFIYVCDTYNHKMKRINTRTKECDTIKLDWSQFDGSPKNLTEPNGLCMYSQRKLLIADTNNHRIVSVDLLSNIVSLFPIVRPSKAKKVSQDEWEFKRIQDKLYIGVNGLFKIKFKFSGDFILEYQSKQKIVISSNCDWVVVSPSRLDVQYESDLEFLINYSTQNIDRSIEPEILIECQLTLCNKTLNCCSFRRLKIVQPISFEDCDIKNDNIIEIYL